MKSVVGPSYLLINAPHAAATGARIQPQTASTMTFLAASPRGAFPRRKQKGAATAWLPPRAKDGRRSPPATDYFFDFLSATAAWAAASRAIGTRYGLQLT
jgi:hypothetical protein